MSSGDGRSIARVASCALLAVALLSACTGRDADLDRFIDATKHEPGGRVEPLPEVKPYESYAYVDQMQRSPFMPGGSGAASTVRPDSHRNREYLEQFALDTLKMVGTLNLGGRRYGLIQARDGRVYRVVTGEHMGQNDGQINEITANKISLTEIVPDGLGGYIERPAAMALNQ
jgi:type IV pilus assembly protein PilP